jgi:hypothetical protein
LRRRSCWRLLLVNHLVVMDKTYQAYILLFVCLRALEAVRDS